MKNTIAIVAIAACSTLLTFQATDAAPLTDTAACNCAGAVRSGMCYNSISEAISGARNGDTVEIGRSQIVSKPVDVASSITLQGVECSGRRPVVAVSISDKSAAFVMSGNSGQKVSLDGFDMAPVSQQYCSALRSEGATRSLKLVDMNFANFVQKDVNGTVIYMESADEFEVQGGSFVKNTLETDPKPKETGGQVHIEEIVGSAKIGGVWKDNRAESLHSLGGALFLGTVKGPVEISGRFVNNFATDGGAVHIRWVRSGGSVDVSGTFERNTVKDLGYKCRGAAVRSLLVGNGATVTLSGTFRENSGGSDCRGAVFAINNVQDRGTVVLSGTFEDNEASEGSVLSITMGAYTGVTKIARSASFSGNVAHDKKDTNILDLRPCGLCQTVEFDTTLEEAGYHGDGATYRGGIAPEHLPEIQDALRWKDWIWYYYGRDAKDRYIRDWGRK